MNTTIRYSSIHKPTPTKNGGWKDDCRTIRKSRVIDSTFTHYMVLTENLERFTFSKTIRSADMLSAFRINNERELKEMLGVNEFSDNNAQGRAQLAFPIIMVFKNNERYGEHFTMYITTYFFNSNGIVDDQSRIRSTLRSKQDFDRLNKFHRPPPRVSVRNNIWTVPMQLFSILFCLSSVVDVSRKLGLLLCHVEFTNEDYKRFSSVPISFSSGNNLVEKMEKMVNKKYGLLDLNAANAQNVNPKQIILRAPCKFGHLKNER